MKKTYNNMGTCTCVLLYICKALISAQKTDANMKDSILWIKMSFFLDHSAVFFTIVSGGA